MECLMVGVVKRKSYGMLDHSLSHSEQAVSSQAMSKQLLEEQGSTPQNQQQPESPQLENEEHGKSTLDQSRFSLKRKQRASAHDWFEEGQNQKSKIIETGFNSVQYGVAVTPSMESNSHNPGSRFTEQAEHTALTQPRTYSQTQPGSSQAHSPTTDQSPSNFAAYTKMPNWRLGDRYRGDAGGRRSPSRDPRINHGQERRRSYPYSSSYSPTRPNSNSGNANHGNSNGRSPPLNGREDDRDWPRDNRESWGVQDISNAPAGPRGSKPTYRPNQNTPQCYPKQQGGQPHTGDPRLAGRTHIVPRPGPVNEAASTSAMDVDPENTPEGGPGTRSGSRTPNTPNTPIYVPPKQKTELFSVLLEFSNRTLRLSSLSMKRKVASKNLERSIEAFDHSSRFHEQFPSLSTQQANDKAEAQQDMDDLNHEYEEEESARDHVIEAIASRVMSSTMENECIRRLEKELSDVKSQLSSQGKIQKDVEDLRNQLRNGEQLQSDLVSLANRVDKIQSQLDEFPNPKSLEQHHSDFVSLDNLVHKIQSRVDELLNLRLDVDKMREELRGVITRIDDQTKAFTKLKNTVDGEDDTGGLLKFVAEAEQTSKELAVSVNQTLTELDDLEKKVDSIRKRQDELQSESEVTALTTEKVQQEVSDLRTSIDSSRADMADMIADQPKRDDAILEEIEKVTKMSEENSTRLESGLGEVRRDFSKVISRIELSISQVASNNTDVKAKTAPAHPTLPNASPGSTAQSPVVGIGRREYENNRISVNSVTDQLKRAIDTLEQKVCATELSLQHLDSRYNNVTTERLISGVASQFPVLFPQIGNIPSEFDQLRNTQKSLQEQVQQHTDKLNKLQRDVEELHRAQDIQNSKVNEIKEMVEMIKSKTTTELGNQSGQIHKLYLFSGLQPPE